MTAAEFKALRVKHGKHKSEVAAYLGRSVRQIDRYEEGAPIPHWVVKLMELWK